MGNLFTFFDEFFKTLHPNLYELGDEETVELNSVEPEIINITEKEYHKNEEGENTEPYEHGEYCYSNFGFDMAAMIIESNNKATF